MKMYFDDKLGHRARNHQNLLAGRLPDGKQVIFQFTGQSVPGVITVIKKDYSKNGKWSYTAWECELADGVIGFVRSQDWETGAWLNACMWQEAILEFKGKEDLDSDAIERFIRANWKATAGRLDKTAQLEHSNGNAALQELLDAQQELVSAQTEIAEIEHHVLQLEEAQQLRAEAEVIRHRVAAAKTAMKKGASLSDLKALLNQ